MSLTAPLAFKFFNTILTGDATLMAMGSPPLSQGVRVYRDKIPQGGAYPALIYGILSPGIPLKVIGNVTVWSELVLYLKGVDKSQSTVQLEPMMDRADVLLESANGVVSGGVIFGVESGNEISYPEMSQGTIAFQHLGRSWRLQAK